MKSPHALLVLILLCLAASGCAAAPKQLEEFPVRPRRLTAGPAAEIRHAVQPGETVWAISRAYGVPVDEIVNVNSLTDVTDIPIGSELLIPGATELRDIPETDLYGKYRPGPVLHWPLAGREILSRFGEQRKTHVHAGLDINGEHGEPVLSAADGTVTYSSGMRGYGKTVVIDHGDGLKTLYGHNTALLVKVGDKVTRGQPIAKVGRTGNASTDHVHFEVHRDGVAVDPLKHL
ncbi:MAG: peptidoglycan DD-metalloendopeptidase family protein [Acidobacteria bacterium]|uniref:Peptidoglycan DD-metalloendopeptidase family protein n=1 Tax=Candidatus Polarisedimenticola svalbardensis TaxID=2886004 RepID=A0A8J6XYF9_9BACT|nr:peptidoglycan DD-metalloendopeptidase family protein [Candidatus Polarisedimenticola svalbardensis]